MYINKFSELAKNCRKLSDVLDVIRSYESESSLDVISKLPPRECAELHVTLGVALISLYRAHLRCQGIDESKHSIAQEEDRLQSYLRKMTPIIVDTRDTLVDNQAAKRMVHTHLAR